MAASIPDDEREPLIPSPTPTLRAGTPRYGATGSLSKRVKLAGPAGEARDGEGSSGASDNGEEDEDEEARGVGKAGTGDTTIKVAREFKEIWAMCLGLATA